MGFDKADTQVDYEVVSCVTSFDRGRFDYQRQYTSIYATYMLISGYN